MIPAFYVTLWLGMTKTANRCGYALTMHGSMNRDMDLVAVPWTDNCDTGWQLVYTLAKKHGLMIGNPRPTIKPHGRKAWVLMLGGETHSYVDLSVMPRLGA